MLNSYSLDVSPTADFSGQWCNQDAVASSLLESVSLITPMLEKFFVRTVAEALPQEPALKARCLEFIREESQHSRLHQKLNARLLAYLGDRPAGLRLLENLIGLANRNLSLTWRLLLTAVLEHFSAVFSKAYVRLSVPLNIEFDFARNLFYEHANEELAHCSVVFDLLSSQQKSGSLNRLLLLLLCCGIGAVYLAISVPWILHRKTGHQSPATLSLLLRALGSRALYRQVFAVLPELFSFARKNYHPNHLTSH